MMKKWDYFELSRSNIQSGLCIYSVLSFKHTLYKAIGEFKRCYMYITPGRISFGGDIIYNNRYRFTEPYQALLPRIVYLQTLLKELKKIK